MLDIKWVRENPELLDKMLISRNAEAVSSRLLSMDESRRKIQTELQSLQSQRNDISKKVGEAKAKGEDASELLEQMKTIGPKVKELEEQERSTMVEFESFIAHYRTCCTNPLHREKTTAITSKFIAGVHLANFLSNQNRITKLVRISAL